jgi:group II intron reverse transcriptase/maturase
MYNRLNLSHLHYVIEFDIKSFFDEVNHSKLMKQIWSIGIHDKHLIWVIKQILKAPIKMPDGTLVNPTKGTPQGGIISPLLANIVLDELDHWVESQWQEHPVTRKCNIYTNNNGSECKALGYYHMKRTRLKEMYIVRYADDFRIFCRTKSDAEKTKIAVTQWLSERLKLEVSQEKTRIVNAKRRYSDFLGFKIRVHKKGITKQGKDKYVVKSHISDKNIKNKRQKLIEQVKRIAKPSQDRTMKQEITLYNQMVTGMQNYYCIATKISTDGGKLNRAVMTILTNRLKTQKGSRLVKKGRELTQVEKDRYGNSAMLRYAAESGEPIYPIGYVRHKNPMAKKFSICKYTPDGRNGLHDNLRVNMRLMEAMMRQPLYDRSAEYADNRISLFSAQWGKCAVTGREFEILEDIHCHHKKPKASFQDGDVHKSDKYENLVLVLAPIHKLIHAADESTIRKYMDLLKLKKAQLVKLNNLRLMAGLQEISKPRKRNKTPMVNSINATSNMFDGAPCAVKAACTVLAGGKA